MENMSPGILCKNKLVMRKTFQLCRTVVSTAGRDGTSREQTSVCGFGDRRLIQGNARGSEQKKKTSMNLSPWSIRFVWARQRQRHRQRERESGRTSLGFRKRLSKFTVHFLQERKPTESLSKVEYTLNGVFFYFHAFLTSQMLLRRVVDFPSA